ncbi:hypothetical protein [Microbispora sp. NBRC 16548]|uniref:hypothetical protein n=1 Tax=Microbispora sp. NBRC 16548 TaxID=3030994 RepID=UPI0025557F81|nr:hypothetical protein [Microbispora sp. NBRC 16548]
MSKQSRQPSRTRVLIEFPSPQAAVEWFDAAAAVGAVPAGSDLFRADDLDVARGVPRGVYLVRKTADRPEAMALRGILDARRERARKRAHLRRGA